MDTMIKEKYQSPAFTVFRCNAESGVMLSDLKNDNDNIYIGIGDSDEEFA